MAEVKVIVNEEQSWFIRVGRFIDDVFEDITKKLEKDGRKVASTPLNDHYSTYESRCGTYQGSRRNWILHEKTGFLGLRRVAMLEIDALHTDSYRMKNISRLYITVYSPAAWYLKDKVGEYAEKHKLKNVSISPSGFLSE